MEKSSLEAALAANRVPPLPNQRQLAFATFRGSKSGAGLKPGGGTGSDPGDVGLMSPTLLMHAVTTPPPPRVVEASTDEELGGWGGTLKGSVAGSRRKRVGGMEDEREREVGEGFGRQGVRGRRSREEFDVEDERLGMGREEGEDERGGAGYMR